MAKNVFKIDGTKVTLPHKFKVEDNQIVNAQRLENGDMNLDHIAWKTKVFCTWEILSENEFKLIQEKLRTTRPFHDITYVDGGKEITKKMYMSVISREYYKTMINELWYYTNIPINFIER